ncbi:MAG: OmpA family protein [Bacteroidales bacterium]|nr:OmpA family protein [Bacteroidales bacterium]
MKKITLAIAAVAIMQVSAWAQDISYPEKKLLEQGNYEKAAANIEKAITKHPDDCMLQYSLYILHSSKGYREYNLYKAYLFLKKSKQYLAGSGNIEKLSKQGINYKFYDTKIEELCQMALREAKEENTITAFNYFLEKFDLAAPQQQNEASACLTSLIYKKVEKENTLKAYKEFVRDHPGSKEAESAMAHIYDMEFDIARNNGGELALSQYMTRYPKSHRLDEAKLMLDRMIFRRKTKDGRLQSYMQFLAEDNPCDEMRQTTEDSIFSLGIRTQNIRALEYSSRSKDADIRKKSALAIHKVWEEIGVSNFSDFYARFKDVDIPESIREKDNNVAAAMAGSLEELIATAAPYRVAYAKLQEYIKEDIEQGNFDNAAQKARKFAGQFGQYRDYINLIKTLEEPATNSANIRPMPASINTPEGNEYAPCISADGKQLLFCGNGRPDNMGNEDIFVSTKTGKNSWGQAVLFPDINTKELSEAPEVLSADNTWLLMYQNGKLFESRKSENGWSKPKSMGKVINFASWQADATFSSNGRVMIYAAKSATDREYAASENIFVSLMQPNGEWGTPFEIGPAINTPFCDRSPVLHPDMKTLYFCSNGHSSLGSMDVFMTRRLSDESWTEWSEPVNLGKEINTVAQDCFYKVSTDGNEAYFSKQTGHNEDLYIATLPEKLKPSPVATISGKMLDTDGNPVRTTLYWEDLETHKVIGQSQVDPTDGSFFIVLPEGKNYGYFINDKKYFPVSNNIDLRHKKEIIRLEENITVATIQKMIDEEIPMVMNNLFFETAKWDLLPASISELERVAKVIKPLGLMIEISGHTDNVGDDDSNQKLSENRANSVKEFLIQQGCSENLLQTRGYGESKPISTNDTPEGRQRNRRVEMKFVK